MKLSTTYKYWGVAMLFLSIGFALTAQTTTLTFSGSTVQNIGTTIYDGQSYSTDVPNIQIDMFNAKTANDATARISYGSFLYVPANMMNTDYNYVCSIDQPSGIDMNIEPPAFWVIMSHNGTEFSFQGLKIGDYITSQRQTKIEGFRNGVSTGFVILQMSENPILYEQLFDASLFPTDKFGNVDEVRISKAIDDGVPGNWAGFNDFKIGTVVLPPSLSVSTTVLDIESAANSTAKFNITSNVAWTVSSSDAWLTVSPTSGSNNATITLTATANPAPTTRKANITVSGTGVASKTIEVSQNIVTDLSTNSQEEAICYPNPVEDELHLLGITAKQITITSLTGRVLLVEPITNGKANLSALPSGIYMVMIEREGESPLVTKIIKK